MELRLLYPRSTHVLNLISIRPPILQDPWCLLLPNVAGLLSSAAATQQHARHPSPNIDPFQQEHKFHVELVWHGCILG